MLSLRNVTALFACMATTLLAVPGAQARPQSGGFRFTSGSLFTRESARHAVVTVVRDDAGVRAQVYYGAWHMSATPGLDYTPVAGRLDFGKGQRSASFSIPIVDHGEPGPGRTIRVELYGGWPTRLGAPSKAVLTILYDDAVTAARDASNPLGLFPPPVGRDPLVGAHFYVDHVVDPGARQVRAWRYSHPRWASMLNEIASQPQTARFGPWDGPDPALDVSRHLVRVNSEEPGSVPMIATYGITHTQCGGHSDSPAAEANYDRWISGFARGVSGYRAVVFLEIDALISTGCLSEHGLEVRMRELRYAVAALSKDPRAVVYVDAGAADALPAARTALLLQRAGVARIEGFFLNATHNDWTSKEISYGESISRMTGGKHFIVNTGTNGRGPYVPHDRVRYGNEVLCMAPGRGLGPRPTANTGYPRVDAFAWIGHPGESAGCRPGAPGIGVYWAPYALELARYADFHVR